MWQTKHIAISQYNPMRVFALSAVDNFRVYKSFINTSKHVLLESEASRSFFLFVTLFALWDCVESKRFSLEQINAERVREENGWQ